ncbi:SPF1 [Symbiodinium sp. CCMP2592]|nr:SPF1 [Symbiodinium sp. CCMP2592]
MEPALWAKIDEIRVFARMTPQGKAKIIEELQKQSRHVLMCGDGGNDVGALKQADAGLALLAGYGNVNTADTNDIDSLSDANAVVCDKKAEEALNKQDAEIAKRNRRAAKDRQAFLWEKQKELSNHQKEWLEEEMQARAKNGDTGVLAQMGAMKSSMGRYTEELKKVMKEYDKSHGNVYDPTEKEKQKQSPTAALEEASGGLPMVRPGDASIAAPFTSKAPSVKNCVDLIRQGRCTLLSALQQQQIMMLNCIINAYVLSALSLEGSRTSERQLMASSWLLTTASLAFTYASPCDRMHPVRPLRSLFHPAVFFSMLGQAAIHLFCMVAAVKMARAAMEEDSPERQAGWSGPSLKDVSEFWKRERARRRGLIEQEEEEDWTTYALNMWQQPFLPNLMNTVVFLVETAQTVAILFVNYKGQPWMKGVMENRALFLSVVVVAGSVAAAAWEFQPQLNALIHLSPFPNDQFRWQVMGLVGMTLAGTFIWDRFCVYLFASEIFKAMVDSAKKTTFRADIVPIFFTILKVMACFLVLGTGNLLMAGLAFWMYRRHSQEADE